MLVLYHSPNSRSSAVIWLLEELGASYKKRIVSIRHDDGSGARDPANPHPHGKVPLLERKGRHVFEFAAIALYLTDLFPEAGCGPGRDDPSRGEYLSWLAWRQGVLEPSMIMRRLKVPYAYGAMGWAPSDEVERVINGLLKRRRFVLGDTFSAADIAVGAVVRIMMKKKVMNETPVLREYVDRLTIRPAFLRALESDS